MSVARGVVVFWIVMFSPFVLGLISALFLQTYLAIILGCVALFLIILLLWIGNGASTNGNEGGLAFLFLASFPAIFIVGQLVGALFVLPWGDMIDWINQSGYHISEFLKNDTLR